MADFYQKQALSQTPTGQFQYNPQGNVGQMLEQTANKVFDKAEEDANRARKNYSFGLWNETETQMKNAAAEHENDPQGLSQALEKIRGEMESKNLDNESKIEWGARFEMARGTLQNRADANYNALQKRQAVSNAYDSFYNHMDTISTAFDNLLSDEATPNDLGNLTNSLKSIQAITNARDNTGLYLLPDSARHSMREAGNKALYDGLVASFGRMTPNERQLFMAKLDADGIKLPSQIDSKTNAITESNLKDIVGPKAYRAFKDYTRSYKEKLKDGAEGDDGIAQLANDIRYDNQMGLIKGLIKEGNADSNVEAMTQLLELSDNVQTSGTDGMGKSKYKSATKDITKEMMNLLRADSGFDPWGFNSGMAVAIEVLKKDGQAGGVPWSDDQNVYMLREFYARAKEHGLDLRDNSSATREKAKELALAAIDDTVKTVVGGNGKDFNSTFLYGRKLNTKFIPADTKENPSPIINSDYFVTFQGNKKVKTYPETGIQVEE